MPKPQAVPAYQVCSECGLDWDLHPKNAALKDCVALLKAELAKKASYPQWSYTYPQFSWSNGIANPAPQYIKNVCSVAPGSVSFGAGGGGTGFVRDDDDDGTAGVPAVA